jgi:hypothetical protein
MEYHLYPPFFEIAPQSSFDEAWEAFCADVLNLSKNTREIRRRTPPDLGVDLLWPTQRVAYQCKAILYGKAGDLPVPKIISSIKRALEKKKDVGWEKYVLCVNVDPTGPQEAKIKAALPEIEFLTPSFWLPECRRFSDAMKERFRLLVRVAESTIERAVDETFLNDYASRLRVSLKETPLTLRVFSNRRKEVFHVPASRNMTVDDFLEVLMRLFRLPGSKSYSEDGCSVSLSYALVVDDKKTSLDQRLGDVGLKDESVVTLWKTMVFRDAQGETQERVIEMITMDSLRRRSRTKGERFADAEEKFTAAMNEAFDKAIQRIESGSGT